MDYTYEVGIDEPAHPDPTIALRLEEVGISNCPYGCKIYKDPFSGVRVLAHNRIYGCGTTHTHIREKEQS